MEGCSATDITKGMTMLPGIRSSPMICLDKAIRFATINVRGLAARRKQNQLFRLVSELELDVIAIQETKVDGEEETGRMVSLFTSRYNAVVSHAVGAAAGCVLFVRQCLGVTIQAVTTCAYGRFVVCDLVLYSYEWRIICVYAPNSVGERRDFFEGIRQYCNSERLTVIMGDFNCVLSASDKTSRRPHSDASTCVLAELVNEFNLVDVAGCLEGGRAAQFTHFQASSHARLDRMYISLDLVPVCHEYHVKPVSFSDHCLVTVTIAGNKTKSQGFDWQMWKLNSKLLSDDSFQADVERHIANMNDKGVTKLGAKWEVFKQNVKMTALERSSAIARQERAEERSLRVNLQRLIDVESNNPGLFIDDIRALRASLNYSTLTDIAVPLSELEPNG